ncbi:siderophore iron transporter [Trichoderma atroviride IMI 206040]|uniref:Siderophore iron transporter n=1 Tax=Hypocrea atroviridis (strain ATCC 20476 / IMI 206040) TaxID=452589 RepID=G9P8S6_HYPAI|nr:siderophore iron transporter [Trichoderma atroviride IMI 206040]EHK41008.1 siderophore iron transporter [Trichoderma atroviride IMI 206040]
MEKTDISQASVSGQDAAKTSQNNSSNIERCSNEEGLTTNAQERPFPVLLSFIWAGLFLLAIAVSLAGQTIISYQPYALSEFNAHSMLSVIGTVQYILYAIVKPALAKTANIWGLLEAFSISIVAILIGFAINAASQNLGSLTAGQIFYTIGQVGIQFLQQILIADITTLENRSILGSLVLCPTIFTSWIGAPIVSAMVPEEWRWGYGMWAIIFPVVSMPLLISLWQYSRRSNTPQANATKSDVQNISALWSRLDVIGHLLLTASLTLILLPMTLSTYPFQSWTSAAKLSMIIIGGCCFIAFTIYELYVSSHPIVSFKLAKDRTVAAGCIIQFVLYLSYYIWAPYFFSFIVIVNNQSAKAATNITASQAVATAVIGLLAAFIIKLTGVYKWAILLGMVLKLIGAGLMLRYSDMSASIVQIIFGQLISGAGTGMISIIAQTAVQAVTAHEDLASVTTLYEVSGAIGGAIGNALSGIIWTALLLPRLRIDLPAAAQSTATEIKNSFIVASSYSPGSPERIAIDKSYTEVMHVLLIVALAVLSVPFFAMFAMKDLNLKKSR